ncbi:putative ABC transporter ATP-binding protein [Planctomycetes bacterium Poly30]|uniref:Energy-dependent translational throttle protein EttA n=1 Tax=Saltatorellus ferox TaxID=2528018 RepID=A0A518ES69_9BACT|nr:putative ABC transporter ATP-binding protein [Planctomycetes bacterium Poly30]
MSDGKIIYHLQDLKKFYDQREVLSGITIAFLEGANIGLIGPNGAGKSTLLRILAGVDTDIEGTARPIQGLSVGYLEQEPPLDETKTVGENIDLAVAGLRAIEARYYEVMTIMGDAEGEAAEKLSKEYDDLQTAMDTKGIWDLDSRLEQAAHALQVPPFDSGITTLSGGERRRVALCKLLLEHPDLLLLDEPTNHLDSESIAWLEGHLGEYDGTVILITHDRYFLDNVVGWMLEIERGKARPYKGNYSAYLDAKTKMLDVKRKSDSTRAKVLEREKEWLSKTPAARTKQSKSRLKRYQDLAAEARAEDQAQSLELRIPPGPRLGDKVLEIKELTKGYGDRTLFKNLNFSMPPQAKLGVIGANGMGKSTLMKIIIGSEQPDSGSVELGSTVQLRFLDQSRTVLDDEQTVFQNITDGNEQLPFGSTVIDSRAYVARFNFKGEDQQRKVGECSGGQRNRVMLAKMLREPANLIIMDEPTNDLDLDTLRVLEEAIEYYPGNMIIVTHDRYFLNRVATHILSFEGEDENGVGIVYFHHGDYESFKDWKRSKGEDLDKLKGPRRKFAR